MKLAELLTEKRAILEKRWIDLIFDSYPPETARFLRREKDRFDNPVAYQVTQGIKGLYGALLTETEFDQINAFLDEIIRIKAIQDFFPSQAIAFIFLLKKLIREELADELKEENLSRECLELESRLDGLALMCFDVYMKRREKLYEIRVGEVKSRISALLRRAGIDVANP